MSESRPAVYTTPRRKQACQRCHTKRIKCLGGVPCRNCIVSATQCTFPLPKKLRTISQLPQILPQPSPHDHAFDPGTIARSPSIYAPGQYRRNEKDFASSRSSNDPRGRRPSYGGDPSCQAFTDHFTAWVVYLKDELLKSSDSLFDPIWGSLGSAAHHISEPALEISIDTTVQEPAPRAGSAKPVTIRLPPYNHSIHLIQVLESAIGHEQHIFRRKDLRSKVWHMHQNPESAQSKDQGWLCHWLAIVALGELYNGVAIHTVDNSLPGSDYYHQSVALLPQVAETPDVQYIATLCLLSLFAFSMNRTNTAYMYVGISLRAALALNLHRDPHEFDSERSNVSESELEHHRRLFWTVYYQDLLTTSTNGRPWGVLDDEITVSYGSSSSHSGDLLLDFCDAEEGNEHLELMRLRSQAYSSIYGYAGTAINPQSHICLLHHDLGESLTPQHLDKMTEFHESLVTWENELSSSIKISRSWNGGVVNLNRVNANMYLIYYQSVLVVLRPALVGIFNDWFDTEVKARQGFPITSMNATSPAMSSMITSYGHSLHAAKEIASLSQWLSEQGALLTYSYFPASYLFTAAITLRIAKAMSPHNTFGISFMIEEHTALDTVLRLLGNQSTARNMPAIEFVRKLDILDNNLQALGMHLQPTISTDIFEMLSTTTSH